MGAKRWLLLAICGILISLQGGCGIYSVTISPDSSEQAINKQEPLDLSVSLRELTVYEVGIRLKLNQKQLQLIDQTFMEEIKKTGLFKEVRPKGEDADIILVKHYSDTLTMSSNVPRELFKWFIWGPLALVLPIPYPYDLGIEGQFEMRAPVAGKELHLRQYKLSYEVTVSSSSIWGFGMDPETYIKEIVRYEVKELSKKILKDFEFLKEYTRLKKANDTEGIKKLIPEIWSGAT